MELPSIKSHLWDGTINIQIVYLRHKYLLAVPRVSYFPLHFPQIISYFVNHQPCLASLPIFLQYEEVPIKWNLPIGVLYDSLHLPTSINDSLWTLTLHYKDYPSTQIIPFTSISLDHSSAKSISGSVNYEKTLQDVITNQLKQSCFVLNGTAKPIMKLSEENSNNLWLAIKSRNLNLLETMNKLIVPRLPKRLPVKILLPGGDVYQAPGGLVTFGEALSKIHFDREKLSPYIHGVDASVLEKTSLEEVWRVFRGLDNFLYVVVTASERETE